MSQLLKHTLRLSPIVLLTNLTNLSDTQLQGPMAITIRRKKLTLKTLGYEERQMYDTITSIEIDELPSADSPLPRSLKSLYFGHRFNESLEGYEFPSGLLHLEFGMDFNQSLEKVRFPSGLQSLRFGFEFNQPLNNVNFPSGLQSLRFGDGFNQPLNNLNFPSGLESLEFGPNFSEFNQSLDEVEFPSGLQHLSFGTHNCFNQPLDKVAFPSGLQSLRFGGDFNQPLNNVDFPAGLQSLEFGSEFNQSLDDFEFPSGMQSLKFGLRFNQPLDKVKFPSGLLHLDLDDASFDQPLERVTLPSKLETLNLGALFNQPLEMVALPSSLKTLKIHNTSYKYPLHQIVFPQSLENLLLPITKVWANRELDKLLNKLSALPNLRTLSLRNCEDPVYAKSSSHTNILEKSQTESLEEFKWVLPPKLHTLDLFSFCSKPQWQFKQSFVEVLNLKEMPSTTNTKLKFLSVPLVLDTDIDNLPNLQQGLYSDLKELRLLCNCGLYRYQVEDFSVALSNLITLFENNVEFRFPKELGRLELKFHYKRGDISTLPEDVKNKFANWKNKTGLPEKCDIKFVNL